MNDFCIVCAVVNCFLTRKISDDEDGVQIAYETKEKVSIKNDLERYLNIKLLLFSCIFIIYIIAFIV